MTSDTAYASPMDWYLGRTSIQRTEQDPLDRIKSYFPSKHYREARAEKSLGKSPANYFPSEKYQELRTAREEDRVKRRAERNETIGKVYDNIVVPTIKATGKGLYKTGHGLGKGLYWTGYGIGKAAKDLGKGILYIAKKSGEAAEKVAGTAIDARLYEQLDPESAFQPQNSEWYRIDRKIRNLVDRMETTGANARNYKSLEKLAKAASISLRRPVSREETFNSYILPYLTQIRAQNAAATPVTTTQTIPLVTSATTTPPQTRSLWYKLGSSTAKSGKIARDYLSSIYQNITRKLSRPKRLGVKDVGNILDGVRTKNGESIEDLVNENPHAAADIIRSWLKEDKAPNAVYTDNNQIGEIPIASIIKDRHETNEFLRRISGSDGVTRYDLKSPVRAEELTIVPVRRILTEDQANLLSSIYGDTAEIKNYKPQELETRGGRDILTQEEIDYLLSGQTQTDTAEQPDFFYVPEPENVVKPSSEPAAFYEFPESKNAIKQGKRTKKKAKKRKYFPKKIELDMSAD